MPVQKSFDSEPTRMTMISNICSNGLTKFIVVLSIEHPSLFVHSWQWANQCLALELMLVVVDVRCDAIAIQHRCRFTIDNLKRIHRESFTVQSVRPCRWVCVAGIVCVCRLA